VSYSKKEKAHKYAHQGADKQRKEIKASSKEKKQENLIINSEIPNLYSLHCPNE
jgi:hypothetical protein